MKLVKALLVWAVSSIIIPLALGAAFSALFTLWNVNANTAARAPGWARLLYQWHGSIITLISAGLLAALCAKVFHISITLPCKRNLLDGGLGFGLAIALIALFTLTDSLRPERGTHPSLGLLPLMLLTLLSALAEELFTKAVIYDAVRDRRGALWATVAAALVFFLIGGGLGGTVISGVNVMLMGVLCCVLYRRGGLWSPTLFRWGWGFATVFLLGQGGGSHSVWRFYGVSEKLLTGGDAGFAYGLMWTLVLIVMICGAIRSQLSIFNCQFSIKRKG